ncbi:unnamed protein product [Rodentolepis nana]|uniref:Zinc finger CCCH domain-containing protein 14 n=1 Tax=Rodentolepis nana TaxID=102285 RepID=A0A0R3TWB1_RODNA|nr:unnamed protein product [Rodentolepis nana]
MELIHKYSPSTLPNIDRGMTDDDFDKVQAHYLAAPMAVSRYAFHKNSERCTFPYKWMTCFAKKIAECGYPTFIYDKVKKLLEPVIAYEEKASRISERCKKWPHCPEVTCDYVHPNNPCQDGDACQNRDTCLFLHGEDYLHMYAFHKNSERCTFPYKWMTCFAKKIAECGYPTFIYDKVKKLLEPVIAYEEKASRISERCKKWPHCPEVTCDYVHPNNPCQHGDACQNRDTCLFLHGEDYLHMYVVARPGCENPDRD